MAVKKIIWHCTYKATNDKLCKWIRSLVLFAGKTFQPYLNIFRPFFLFIHLFAIFFFFWFRIFQFAFFLHSFWLGFCSFFHTIFWIRIFVVYMSFFHTLFLVQDFPDNYFFNNVSLTLYLYNIQVPDDILILDYTWWCPFNCAFCIFNAF